MGRVQRRKSKQPIDQSVGVIGWATRKHQHFSGSALKGGRGGGLQRGQGHMLQKKKMARGLRDAGGVGSGSG